MTESIAAISPRPGPPAANPDGQRVQASLDGSRRQQAVLLVAQWAAQQMAQRTRGLSAAINDDRKRDDKGLALSAKPPIRCRRPEMCHPKLG